jgi:hypothetical protein
VTNGLHDPRRRLFTIGDPPCPWDWDRNPDIDTCCHWWRIGMVVWDDGYDYTVYCERCRAPRCSSALSDNDPCMERRHHRGVHVYLSGRFLPIGYHLEV